MSNQFQVSFREEGADKGHRKNVEKVKVPVWEVHYCIYNQYESEVLKREFFINKEDAEKRAECFKNYKQPMMGDCATNDLWWACGDETQVGWNIQVRQLEAYSVVENDEEVFLGIPDEDTLITVAGVEVA
jgi:hypothetical protein|tara:strand:+ start:116 stop:505 length:390 start_codon:yes stop_codon:yes gene_type:complete